MTETDRPRFGAALMALLEVFGRELSKPAVALYFEALSDLEWADVERGAKTAMLACRFMPVPAELRELAGHGLERQEQAIERAWQAWKLAARKHGAWWSALFEDGAIARALVAMWGSWPGACLAEHSEEMWASKRKEFGRVYPICRREPMYLAGQFSLINCASRGQMTRGVEPPERIALVGQDGQVQARELPPGGNPLALLTGDLPALPSGEPEPTPEEATAVLARLRAHVAQGAA